jgi:hypothetical protein
MIEEIYLLYKAKKNAISNKTLWMMKGCQNEVLGLLSSSVDRTAKNLFKKNLLKLLKQFRSI